MSVKNPSPDSHKTQSYLSWLWYGLTMLLFLALSAIIIFFTGGAAALPIIGSWFLGMNPVLASVLASGFLVALFNVIFLPGVYVINKVINWFAAPPKSLLSEEEMSKYLTSALKLFSQKTPSQLTPQDQKAIRFLQSHLDANLEKFVSILLAKFDNDEGICFTLSTRESLSALDGSKFSENTLRTSLKTIIEGLNNTYKITEDSQGLTIEEVKTPISYRLDRDRIVKLSHPKASLFDHIHFDALLATIGYLTHRILQFDHSEASDDTLQAIGIKASGTSDKMKEMINKWVEERINQRPPKPSSPPKEDATHYKPPYERQHSSLGPLTPLSTNNISSRSPLLSPTLSSE